MTGSPPHRTPASTPGRGEAVVLGGGIAGLLACAVLAREYDQVTLVERDRLPTEPGRAAGVPQGRHVHVLLSRGATAIDEILPGFLDGATRVGGVTADNLNQFHFEVDGHVLCQDDSTSDRVHLQSRPFLEGLVAARVRSLSNVRVLDRHDVVDLLWDATDTRVVGATVAPHAAPEKRLALGADLVVSALGRNGRVGAWLTEHGFDTPPDHELRIDLLYVSRLVRLDPTLLGGYRGVLVGPRRTRPAGLAIVQQENHTWIVTLEGFIAHHPPTEADEWLEAAVALTPPQCAAALREAEPITDISAHRFPSNLWRRYDKLDRFPGGLLVGRRLGLHQLQPDLRPRNDGRCPGGSGAGRAAAVGSPPTRRARYFKQASKPVRVAWQAAVGADLSMPPDVVAGHRSMSVRAMKTSIATWRLREHDPEMAWNFLKVTGLDTSARALFSPHAVRRATAVPPEPCRPGVVVAAVQRAQMTRMRHSHRRARGAGEGRGSCPIGDHHAPNHSIHQQPSSRCSPRPQWRCRDRTRFRFLTTSSPKASRSGRATPSMSGRYVTATSIAVTFAAVRARYWSRCRGGRVAVGMRVDRARDWLVVAGGPTGHAWVYDADDGTTVADLVLGPPGCHVLQRRRDNS